MPCSWMALRTAPLAICTLLLAGCPDDGGDDDGSNDDGPTTVATTDDPTTAADTANTDTGPDGTDTGSTSTPGSDSGSTTDVADSGSSGSEDSSGTEGFVEPIELFNDGWIDGNSVSLQGGFEQGECWASVYVPDEAHYPFVIDAVRMLVGGADVDDAFPFTLSLYTVDGDNRPDTEIDSAEVDLTGMAGDFDVVNLGVAGIDAPVITEGNFAVAVCFSSHAGFPGIAADADGGLDHPDRSWIFSDGSWTQSGDFGLTGDWVMRAVVLPTTR